MTIASIDLRFPAPAAHALCAPPRPAAITWRRADAADIDFLRSLYAELRADELAAIAWPPALKQDFLAQQFALQHHHYTTHFPHADFLVIEQADRAIGRLYLDRADSHWHLIDIALLASTRGHGIGGLLIGHIQALAKRQGADLHLHVQRDNGRARALYMRLGFHAGALNGQHLAMHFPAIDAVS